MSCLPRPYTRPYTGRLALFGERVLGFLKLSTKGSRLGQRAYGWERQLAMMFILLLLAMMFILLLFLEVLSCLSRGALDVSRNLDTQMVGEVEASPWQFGYASLGAQLICQREFLATHFVITTCKWKYTGLCQAIVLEASRWWYEFTWKWTAYVE